MIDRSLNYGRHHIRDFLSMAMPYELVIDIGAGKGNDLDIATSINPRTRGCAVEAYPPYIELLKNKGLEVYPINIERDKLPFEDESVDVVIANQVLEHTKEIYWIFHEVSRVLKQGGSFIIGVPNLASLHNRLLLLLGRQPTPIQTSTAHIRGFTLHDIMKFNSRIFPGGYCKSGFGGSNFYPFPPFLAKPLAVCLPNLAWGLFLHLNKLRHYNDEYIKFPVTEQLETNFFLGES